MFYLYISAAWVRYSRPLAHCSGESKYSYDINSPRAIFANATILWQSLYLPIRSYSSAICITASNIYSSLRLSRSTSRISMLFSKNLYAFSTSREITCVSWFSSSNSEFVCLMKSLTFSSTTHLLILGKKKLVTRSLQSSYIKSRSVKSYLNISYAWSSTSCETPSLPL